jgi:hypothetical protein
MKQPRLSTVIERRLLVNYRVDPDIAASLLPAPLRPQQVGGWAVAGICLIRLGQIRPVWVPRGLGLRSENAAHRIAVQWDGPQGTHTGVFIPRRDTGSALAVLAGGRLFPGLHHQVRIPINPITWSGVSDHRESEAAQRPTLGGLCPACSPPLLGLVGSVPRPRW